MPPTNRTTCLRYILILLLGLLPVLPLEGASPADSLLRKLDGMLPGRERFAAERRQKINSLSAELPRITDLRDRYNIYRGLFSAYRTYRCDSAMAIAEARLRLARQGGDPNMTMSASLNLAESYSAMGNYHEAVEILDSLPRADMQPYQRKYLYNLYQSTFQRLADRDAIGDHKLLYTRRARAYRDSSLALFSPSDENYHYLEAWRLMDAARWKEALAEIRRTERRFGPSDGHPARQAQKARIFHHLAMPDSEIVCLARASIINIGNARKDSHALIDLAIALNDAGDTRRAYSYIRAALEDAETGNAAAISPYILDAFPIIDNAADLDRARHERAIIIFLAVTVALAAVLALALRVSRRRNGRIKSLASRLKQQSDELAAANGRLSRASSQRAAYIRALFEAHSGYIRRISDFRKNISRLLTVKKYSEAADAVRDNSIESDELKELYARFDEMFLSLFPDFIERYNTLVRPDDRIDVNSRQLPAPLRIPALMKLGVTSTSGIASMLHYTPQTIYNYRNRLKALFITDYAEAEAALTAPEVSGPLPDGLELSNLTSPDRDPNQQ